MNDRVEHPVGSRTPLLEAEPIVTGTALYSTDLYREGMLHCRLRYSDHPRARVIKVDTARAQSMPGVAAVITAADAPTSFLQLVGLSVFDRSFLVSGMVRCVNDVIAAVAAVDEVTAEAAVNALDVEYEVLSPVLSFEQAVAENAPLVHEDKPGYHIADYMRPFFDPAPNNIATQLRLQIGDVGLGRQQSAVVVNGTFTTQRMEHFSLEPHAALAEWDRAADRLTIWCSTGKTFRFLNQLAPVLGLPMSRIRVLTPHVGGDFGGKGQLAMEPYVALLARITGRPIKGVYSREEEFIASSHKTPFEIDLELGLSADGLLKFMKADMRCDTGAHDTYASMVQVHAAAHLAGTYEVPNLLVNGRVAYTNNISSGSFRGFGSPQATFARESLLDEAARLLRLDPIDLRLKNAWQPGSRTATGEVLDPERYSISVSETLQQARRVAADMARDLVRPAIKSRMARGIGVATGHQGIGGGIWAGADVGSAILKANFDGSFSLNVGVGDVGQGISTTLAQIVAEELQVMVDQLSVSALRDTDVAPYDGGASASRQLFVTGSAAHSAAVGMREKLREIATHLLEVAAEDLELVPGAMSVRGSPGRIATFEQIVGHSMRRLGEQPIVVGRFGSQVHRLDAQMQGAPYQAYDYVTQVVEVEVDRDTGVVTVTKVATIQDVGRAINPMIVEGQMEGGAMQGLGFALMEQIVLADGYVLNPHAFDYRIPRFRDSPAFRNVILEHPNPRGPYGAKGAGEAPMIPIAAAVANAIHDALGVRVRQLPITSDRVLAGLDEMEVVAR